MESSMSQLQNGLSEEATQLASKRSSRTTKANDLDYMIRQKYQHRSREQAFANIVRRSTAAKAKQAKVKANVDYCRYDTTVAP